MNRTVACAAGDDPSPGNGTPSVEVEAYGNAHHGVVPRSARQLNERTA